MTDKIWTAKEAAKILDCHVNMVYHNARKAGILYDHPAMFSDEDIVMMRNGFTKRGELTQEASAFLKMGLE